MNDALASFLSAVVVVVVVVLLGFSIADVRGDNADLKATVEIQQRQLDQANRQIAQLNGRVFLGTDIPDTVTGVQP